MGSWLFGSSKSVNKPAAPAAGLRVQSSIQGKPVPIVWGTTRIAGNLIWYGDFRAVAQATGSSSGGKGGAITGGGSKGQTTSGTYNYYATPVLGLCEGPITGVTKVWTDKSAQVGSGGFTVLTGSYAQTGWSYLNAAHPTQALNYRGLAFVGQASASLGTSPNLPNLTWEVKSVFTGAAGTVDANPKDVVVDFLTNSHYGVGWPTARLDTALSVYSGYCLATGMLVSTALVDQKDAASFLKDLMQATNSEFRWSYGQLSVVPYGETAVSAGTINVANEPRTVPAAADSSGFYKVTVNNSASFYLDQGVTDTGTGFVFTLVAGGFYFGGSTLSAGQYSYSHGVYHFSASDANRNVTIHYEWAATGAYSPDSTPIYDLTDADFLPNQGGSGSGMAGGQPIVSVRRRKSDMLNSVKVEFLDRGNNYDPAVVEARDQASIDVFGLRTSDLRQLHVFNVGSGATQSAILQLQREQVPNTYTFTVGPWFALPRVLDLVTLTRATMGMVRQGVRITEIQENQDSTFTVTAEEYMGTVGAPLFGPQASAATPVDPNADPGNANAPIVFEPVVSLTQGLLQVRGAVSGVNTSLWGGAHVWISYDNVNYVQVGTVRGAARMGTLSATLATQAPGPVSPTLDTTHTLSVDLTESAGTLASVSATDFDHLNTLCYVDGELIAYETATLTATNKYDLTTLNRGCYGTTISSHAIGSPFARLDTGIFSFDIDASRIGDTVFIKLQSFNLWGGGVQNLASIGAFTHVISDAGLASPPADPTHLRTVFANGVLQLWWDEVTDFRPVLYEVRKGASFASALKSIQQAHPPYNTLGDDTYWVASVVTPAQGTTVYDVNPPSVVIAGSLLTQNVIRTVNEQTTTPGWNGTLTNVTKTGADPTAIIQLNQASASGTYEIPAADQIDVGYVAQCLIGVTFTATGTPVGQNILSVADILNDPDILGAVNAQFVSVYIEIAISQDGSTFGSYQKFVTGVYLGRKFKFRATLQNSDIVNTTAFLLSLIMTLTVPARIDHYASTTSTSANTTITFKPDGSTSTSAYNFGPNNSTTPYVSVTILNSSLTDAYVQDSLSLSALTFHISTGSTATVSRNVNIITEGA